MPAETEPCRRRCGCSSAARRVVDVGTPIARVSLTSADVADALVTSPNQLLVNGKMPGTISMFVWDRGGAIRRYEVVVQRDLARLTEQMKQLFPERDRSRCASNGKQRRAVRAASRRRTSPKGGRPSPPATSTRRKTSSSLLQAAGRRGRATRCCCASASPK